MCVRVCVCVRDIYVLHTYIHTYTYISVVMCWVVEVMGMRMWWRRWGCVGGVAVDASCSCRCASLAPLFRSPSRPLHPHPHMHTYAHGRTDDGRTDAYMTHHTPHTTHDTRMHDRASADRSARWARRMAWLLARPRWSLLYVCMYVCVCGEAPAASSLLLPPAYTTTTSQPSPHTLVPQSRALITNSSR